MIDLKEYQTPAPKSLGERIRDFSKTPAARIGALLIGLGALRIGATYLNSDLQPGGRNDMQKGIQEAEARNHIDVNINGKYHPGNLVSPLSTALPPNGYFHDGQLFAFPDRVSR